MHTGYQNVPRKTTLLMQKPLPPSNVLGGARVTHVCITGLCGTMNYRPARTAERVTQILRHSVYLSVSSSLEIGRDVLRDAHEGAWASICAFSLRV